MTLGHAEIEALVPHRGAMCLLERMADWQPERIDCIAINHRDSGHPLRTACGLMASAAIEYGAQAAALHGALGALAVGATAAPGYLASARDVRLSRWRLDDLPAVDPDELQVAALRQAGDATRLLYAFTVSHGGREIASGRLAVVLQALP